METDTGIGIGLTETRIGIEARIEIEMREVETGVVTDIVMKKTGIATVMRGEAVALAVQVQNTMNTRGHLRRVMRMHRGGKPRGYTPNVNNLTHEAEATMEMLTWKGRLCIYESFWK